MWRFAKNASTRAVEGAGAMSWWICSIGHFEYDGHTLHKRSQRRRTADWLAHGRVTVYRCTVRASLTGCQVTSRPLDRFSRYAKWTNTFRTAHVKQIPCLKTRGIYWTTARLMYHVLLHTAASQHEVLESAGTPSHCRVWTGVLLLVRFQAHYRGKILYHWLYLAKEDNVTI
jgi:hypothetical protein